MFDTTSRYNAIETVTSALPDGRIVAYKLRRFLPPLETMQTIAEVDVTQDDRLDRISARTFGSAELFWMVCDGNVEMDPFNLTAVVGRKLRIPAPRPQDTLSMLGRTSS